MKRTPSSLASKASARSVVVLALALAATAARAARPSSSGAGTGVLRELSHATVRIAERVSPSVVQVQVTGLGLAESDEKVDSAFVARQHAIGSGVIVDPDGYILTSNHVVSGAQRVQVLIPPAPGAGPGAADAGRRLFDAKVIGTEPNTDLALLKIAAKGLRALRLDAAADVRQGELVFAIGSPEGLESTITMGIVGSAARQVDTRQPMEFIQTDAPINPGNSGGPLVDADGTLVGINTFLLSESGGSQGLGFAIPAAMAKIVYESLRRDGRVHLVDAGLGLQAIDRPLALGLHLPRDWGVVVGDVAPGGPAEAAGVQPGDVIASFDGHPIADLAAVTTARYLHRPTEPIRLVLLRGERRLAVSVEAKESPLLADLTELAGQDKGLVPGLGIIAVDVGPTLRGVIPKLLIGKGVVVAARTLDTTAAESGLQTGDVIHAVNRTEIESVDGLRRVLRGLKRGDPVAIQVERDGRLAFLSFEME